MASTIPTRDRSMARQIIRRTAQAWLLLVVVGSLQPARLLTSASLPSAGAVRAGGWNLAEPGPATVPHREIHWLAFGGAAFLLLLLSGNWRAEGRALISTSSLGLLLEYLQHLVYHNPIEWFDVRDDVCAALAAFAFYRFARAARIRFQAGPCLVSEAGCHSTSCSRSVSSSAPVATLQDSAGR